MPNLEKEAVHQFWHDYDRRTLYRIVTSMEGVESWSVDHIPIINDALNALGNALDTVKTIDIQDKDDVIKILAQTKAARALRLMQYMDVLSPGTASKLLMYSEDASSDPSSNNVHADLFLKRNLAFERLQLLGRVFAAERVNLITKALEASNED